MNEGSGCIVVCLSIAFIVISFVIGIHIGAGSIEFQAVERGHGVYYNVNGDKEFQWMQKGDTAPEYFKVVGE